MKGVSTIIGIMLMLIITIALVGLAYAYFIGVFTGQTRQAISYVDSYSGNLVIQNIGTEPVRSFTIFKVNGNDVVAVILSNDIIFQEDFNDGTADMFVPAGGTWAVDTFRYRGDGRAESAQSDLPVTSVDGIIDLDIILGESKPLDVMIVLDKSGSIQPFFQEVKDAANTFVDEHDLVQV